MVKKVLEEHLKKNGKLAAGLAVYNGSPAVFDRVAPSDQDPGWQGQEAACYPRLIYRLDMQKNPEEKTAGSLFLHYIAQVPDSAASMEIELTLQEAVDGYFFSDEADTIAATWSRTDASSENQAVKVTAVFDVAEFPPQPKAAPDPVEVLGRYVKGQCQSCALIGRDHLQEAWLPTKGEPAVGIGMTELGSGSMAGSYHVTWCDALVGIRVICPDHQVRLTLLKTLSEGLSETPRLILADQSPFTLRQVSADMDADPLRTGQLMVKGTYGILRTYPRVQKLKQVNVKEAAN